MVGRPYRQNFIRMIVGRNFFEFKIHKVVGEMVSKCPYYEKSQSSSTEQIRPMAFILTTFRAFEAALFTVQRLVELLHDPSKQTSYLGQSKIN
uniref:Uncharacterized protein n=1 Tax=Romanomermis culicivorax TaxID=13658 RepID=A0A915KFD6_ROMCU